MVNLGDDVIVGKSNGKIKYIDEIDLKGKKVMFRFDFNVPLDASKNITDDIRIHAALPSINYALDEGASVIIISHLGRPKGKRDDTKSLAPVAKRLSRLLKKEVKLAPDCIGPEVEKLVAALVPGDIMMLENLRFHAEEELNNDGFAKKLAAFADVYIDDAFGNAHRGHASNVGITKYVKVCGAGFLMKKEIQYFQNTLEEPVRPFVAIIGGSKVSDKLPALRNLIKKVDKMIIGGGMAYTFLAAQGMDIGDSLCEKNLISDALDIMQDASMLGVKFYLPVDNVVAQNKTAETATKIIPVQEIKPGWMGLDIGPATTTLFREVIANAKTIIWNGPMGVFEIGAFSRGTSAMVHAVAESHALTIVGGGDTDEAVRATKESDNITYISTGGGASLELLEGKTLPAIKALEEAAQNMQ